MHARTPLVRSDGLSRRAGAEVWLKMESAQPVGSFKIRGMGHACTQYQSRGARGFVSSSGGNAGLAVAYAGRELGLPVTVVVPTTTTPRAIELIREQQAEVKVHGANWNEAHAQAMTLAGPDRPLIHPYDDPLLWDGHASLVDEVHEAWSGSAPDVVILSVGGGGLLCGVVRGLERRGWTGARILACETEGAASLAAACRAGELVALDGITSIATSLGAREVSAQALAFAQQYSIEPRVVTDADAVRACVSFLDDHRTLVEPACGASLAPVYQGDAALRGKRVLVVVCGGVGVTLEQLRGWQQRFL